MPISPFHALYKARTLSSYAFGKDKLVPVFASSNINVYPYQIATAMFAMRSPYLKGVILCDEGSLGKTYEAMLVITQKWYEGKGRILIIVPTQLLYQWTKTIDDSFSIPFFSIDNNEVFNSCVNNGQANPFEQDGIVITTYDYAAEKAEYIEKLTWDIVVFEEAHRLRKIYTDDNTGDTGIKESVLLRKAVGNAFKILLTATPMQNDIMDLFGLIYFIDETIFPDADAFYKRYFRRLENYPELAERVSKFCFRTTRLQVQSYVKIPKRIPVTVTYTSSPKEQQLYNLIDAYLKKSEKLAYPKMEQYDLALLLFRTLSSSTFALAKTLQAAVKRIEADCDELGELNEMLTLCESITENSKGTELLAAIKTGFAQLKINGANRKAIIFTENKTTQKYLYDLLKDKYKTLTYSGDKSRNYSIMNRFKDEAQILITTDIAAEGFNLEFCSYVINYDLPYNTLTIEQRINRCHRQGQQNDVLVLNFLNQNNFADVRMLELINKRVLQFDGIIGLSDNVIGNFGAKLDEVFGTARTKDDIQNAFNAVLTENEDKNKQLVTSTESTLFTSFSKDISDKIVITPQYIKDKSKEINDDLWFVTKYFFDGKSGFTLDDKTRTVRTYIDPPKVFTGARLGRNEYSMSPEYQPRSGRHTITGSLAKNILKEIFWQGIPDSGTVTVNSETEKCTIGFYEIKVKPKSMFWGGYSYYVFTGKTASGRRLTDEECRKIMDFSVLSFTKDGDKYGERDGISKTKPHEDLDDYIDATEYIHKTITETQSAEKEEIDRLKSQTNYKKAALDRNLDTIRSKIKTAESELEKVKTRIEKLSAQKQFTTLQRDFKQGEQSLFIDDLQLEQQLEEEIKSLLDKARITVTVKREFIIRVEGLV